MLSPSDVEQHVLQSFLPERPNFSYNLRDHSHNRNLLAKTASLSVHDFIIRMLYKDCY